jgi:hypothetical protein
LETFFEIDGDDRTTALLKEEANMIDVSLLLRSFLCGVVGGRTSKSEKKSLFGEKSISQITLFQTHHFSLRNSLSLSLSFLFWSKNSLLVFCLKLFLSEKKNSKKQKKRWRIFSL